jgi:hypothetical protein
LQKLPRGSFSGENELINQFKTLKFHSAGHFTKKIASSRDLNLKHPVE